MCFVSFWENAVLQLMSVYGEFEDKKNIVSAYSYLFHLQVWSGIYFIKSDPDNAHTPFLRHHHILSTILNDTCREIPVSGNARKRLVQITLMIQSFYQGQTQTIKAHKMSTLV